MDKGYKVVPGDNSGCRLDKNLVSGFQRYETAIESKLYRAISQLERLQRARQGEFVPAPESVDVSIHSGREHES
jgi:hypothetical protein